MRCESAADLLELSLPIAALLPCVELGQRQARAFPTRA
jgi:hypothetical protein